MDTLPLLLEKLQQETSYPDLEKHIEQLIEIIDDKYKDEDENVQKAVVESGSLSNILPLLGESQDHPAITAKAAQLIAELAKAESVRVPLVNMGVVPPLLKLIQTDSTPLIAKQVCRALGNICFDNDLGRQAVDEGEGVGTCLQLISAYTKKEEEEAARVRVLACGFVLNLTNECEWLEDKAVESGALKVLDACLKEHAADEDLYNMGVAAFLRISDCDAAKSEKWLESLVGTMVWVVSRENTGHPLVPVLEELNIISEKDDMKNPLADGCLPSHLIRIIQYNTGPAAEDEDNDSCEECVKLASDLLLSLLVGDGSMEKLYGGGEGQVFRQCVQWLDSDMDGLKVLGALAVGNFARSDSHCRQLVDSQIVESLLSVLKSSSVVQEGEEPNVTLQHAVLSSLRNLAIPASNKGRLLELGVMTAVLELKHTDVMAVTFKLLGVLRMLIDGQEAAATSLGQDRDFLNCLVDWCAVEEHAGVKGEATRLMAWTIKNSKTLQVIRNMVRAEGMQHLVTMATSEHMVMQNEALIALNLVASTVLGEAAVSLKEADLAGTVLKILKNDETKPELLCNTLALIRTMGTADGLRQDLVTSGVLDVIRTLSKEHAHQGVKDNAASALTSLEDQMNR
ncbi:rap1 GTPase-GDP dissociation stimulator 1-B-like isoform X2 [Babylonia areolata]|uniref:rap1 GTPase-GDP dissociation stimulator 1-B-like isoform X2 n=1 Tax=Babylonia areolata TaxID=304850 RepID=UPI003FD13B16